MASNASDPLEVEIGYKVNCVSDIQVISSTFTVDIKLFYRWKDPRAIGIAKGTYVDVHEKGLFEPEIVVCNAHALELTSETTKISDSTTGELKRTLDYKGSLFITKMDLKLFPFDCQNLELVLKPRVKPSSEVVLVPAAADKCAFQRAVIHEWNIVGHIAKEFLTDPSQSTTHKQYSTVYIVIQAQRQPGWFVNNVFIVSASLLIFTWTTYLFEYVSQRACSRFIFHA